MIIRTSNLIPEMREALFRCTVCSLIEAVEIDRGRITEPKTCRLCSAKYSSILVHNRSVFSDKQLVKLQEAPGVYGLLFPGIVVCTTWLMEEVFMGIRG